MAEKYKARYISDEELTTLAKFLTQQEMSTRLGGLSQQRISQRLTKIKRQQAKDKTKKEPAVIDPKKVNTVDLIQLSYDLLITERDKPDVSPQVKVAIARELTRVAQTQSLIRDKITLEKGMQRICNRLEELLKEADPTIAQKISKFILEDEALSWLITGKPPVLTEETTKEKVEDKEEENTEKPKLDSDLL